MGRLINILKTFDEGERLLFVYRTWSSNRSVCHAISRFGRHLGPDRQILPRSHVFSFSHPRAGIYFVTLVHRVGKGWRFFCIPIFSQFYWPSSSTKEYPEDHSQCLTCCYLHVLYLEVKRSKWKKYSVRSCIFEKKWNSNELLSGRINNNTGKDSCWYSYW